MGNVTMDPQIAQNYSAWTGEHEWCMKHEWKGAIMVKEIEFIV